MIAATSPTPAEPSVFGSWSVIRAAPRRNGLRHVRCRCRCGTERDVYWSNLTRGMSRSCGCDSARKIADAKRTHGQSGSRSAKMTPEYRAWCKMKHRCKPGSRWDRWYASRGIRVCDEWARSFETFFAEVGPRPSPSHSIDRIDNDGNYRPGNVRWATRSQQMTNRRWEYKLSGVAAVNAAKTECVRGHRLPEHRAHESRVCEECARTRSIRFRRRRSA